MNVMQEEVVLVNDRDEVVGRMEKLEAHRQGLRQKDAHDVQLLRAERHTDTDLAGSSSNLIGHYGVQTHQYKHQPQSGRRIINPADHPNRVY